MAGYEPHYARPVQIISIQTYIQKLNLGDNPDVSWFREADLVFYDEAHASVAKTRKAVLDLYKNNAIIVGLTATPCRADGRPLGAIYQDIVTCSSIKELTDLKYLVPGVYYGSTLTPNLQKIPMVAGDYNKKVLGQRIDKPKLVGDILTNWLRIAADRQTVIFATNVKHSLHIKNLFEEHGISIEHIDAHTPADHRIDTLNRFESGEIQVVTNVGVYSEGADFPWVSCIVLARPSKSYARYMQMAGRGLRPYPDKNECVIIDHAGLVERHGFMDEPVDWTLAGEEKAWKKPKKKEQEEKPPLQCEQCLNLFRGKRCPCCGLVVKGYGKKIDVVQARLHRLNREKKKTGPTPADKARFLAMAEFHCREKEYEPGWTAHTYHKKYKVWPPRDRTYETIKPDKSFRNFLTYLNIRYIMGVKKGNGK
jgi:superfamily II DNA or RNA helicase